MNFDFKTEKKENSQMLLTITFPKDEVKTKYDEKLKEIQKEIILKGFRKGKAPISIIEAKYKEAILNEVSTDILDEAFKNIYDKLEKKPLMTSTPTIKDYKIIDLDKDYSIDLIYDVYPDFEYDDYTNIEIIKDEIIIGKEDIEKEIEEHLKNIATIESKDGPVSKNDIAYIKFVVKEDGKEIEKNEGTHITITESKDKEDISKDLIGLKKGDKKTIKKKSKSKDKDKEDNNKDIEIEVEVLDVKKEILPELTDDVVKEIDPKCSNVKEFKEKIETNLKKYVEHYIKEKNIEEIMNKLIDSYKGDIPQSMVQSILDSSYNELLSKVKGNEKLLEKRFGIKNKEEYYEKSKDSAIKQVKNLLIIRDLLEKEKIEVSEKEINEYIDEFLNKDRFEKEFFRDYIRNSKQHYAKIKDEVEIEKLYDKILEKVKVKNGKKIKFKELLEIEKNN